MLLSTFYKKNLTLSSSYNTKPEQGKSITDSWLPNLISSFSPRKASIYKNLNPLTSHNINSSDYLDCVHNLHASSPSHTAHELLYQAEDYPNSRIYLKTFQERLAAGLIDLNSCDTYGQTLLHIIASSPFLTSKGLLKQLLYQGASPKLKNEQGLYPLDLALWQYNWEAFDTLRLAGACFRHPRYPWLTQSWREADLVEQWRLAQRKCQTSNLWHIPPDLSKTIDAFINLPLLIDQKPALIPLTNYVMNALDACDHFRAQAGRLPHDLNSDQRFELIQAWLQRLPGPQHPLVQTVTEQDIIEHSDEERMHGLNYEMTTALSYALANQLRRLVREGAKKSDPHEGIEIETRELSHAQSIIKVLLALLSNKQVMELQRQDLQKYIKLIQEVSTDQLKDADKLMDITTTVLGLLEPKLIKSFISQLLCQYALTSEADLAAQGGLLAFVYSHLLMGCMFQLEQS